jgi:hypothetical protein
MLEYLRFILAYPRLLAFGFLLTLGSSFGQTYFIALFSDDLRALFDLGHGEFRLGIFVGDADKCCADDAGGSFDRSH